MEYKHLRKLFQPARIQAIFILESPPKSGEYFYDPDGRLTEHLFAAMMQLLKYTPMHKRDSLGEFQKRGFMVVDASYVPVNDLKGKYRDERTMSQSFALLEDIGILNPNKTIPLILVKANICRLMEPLLKKQGFLVVNEGTVVPFPSSGQQTNFREKIALVIEKSGISLKALPHSPHAPH
jgi:hypothetical protein